MARIHAMRHFFGLLITLMFVFGVGGCVMLQSPYVANGGYGAAPAFGGYAGQYAQPAQSGPLTAEQAAQLEADAMASEGGSALATLQWDAKRGDAEAQQYLGMFYQAEWQQTRMMPYLMRSVVWTRRAAKKGMPPAQYNLALMYMDGNGVKHSARRAVYWMKRSAAQQDSDAQYTLGMWYMGETAGIAKNLRRSFRLFRAAAKQNNPVGEYCLASAYQNGSGTAANALKADYWMHKAAAAGVVGAQNALAAARAPVVGAAPRATVSTAAAVASAGNIATTAPRRAAVALRIVASAGHIAATTPKKQSGPPYTHTVLIGRFSVSIMLLPRPGGYVPPYAKVLLTPAGQEHLCQSIERLPITLGRAKNGGYTVPSGPAVAKNSDITMPFGNFSSPVPQKYDVFAVNKMTRLIRRFVNRKLYRSNIAASVVLPDIFLVWPKGFRDFRKGATTGEWVVVLRPRAPFAPDTTEAQFNQHINWYLRHFMNPVLGAGNGLFYAGDISPNSTNFPASQLNKPSSLPRREAMDWDGKSMPRKTLLRLAHDGNRIAQFELRMKTHPIPNGVAVPWAQTQPPLPTMRGMRSLRNEARNSWMALYQLDTYAILQRDWNEPAVQSWLITAARYYMGTLFDPRRTPDERVVPKNALLAIKWYQWANPSSPIPVAEQRAYGGNGGHLKHGPETKHFWNLAQQAIAADRGPSLHPRLRPRFPPAVQKAIDAARKQSQGK